MRRVLTAGLAITFSLGLAACGGGEQAGQEAGAEKTAEMAGEKGAQEGAAAEITMAMARHVAAQHVEAIRIIEEQEGRDAALDTYVEAAARLGDDAGSIS